MSITKQTAIDSVEISENNIVHVRTITRILEGAVLTIECEDATCTDTVSWMVIGERQDKHIMNTDWTDENGKVVIEPVKPAERQPYYSPEVAPAPESVA